MTRPVRFPRFYVTGPSPCPYLPGRWERKIFTRLSAPEAPIINDALTNVGFRRSQSIAYRPACHGCNECISVRIVADEFKPGKTFRRTINRNADLKVSVVPAMATEEQFELLRRYLDQRHADGGMADMDALDYRVMVEDSPVETNIVEFRRHDGTGEGELVGVSLTDIIGDGLSMVYSFFDPSEPQRSLGTYLVLAHLNLARDMALPYVYLGYWIRGCRKMSYKDRFRPMEALSADGWYRL